MTTMTSASHIPLTGRIRRLSSAGDSLYIQVVRRELEAAGLEHGREVKIGLPNGGHVSGVVKTSGSTPWIGPAGGDSNRSITAALRDAGLEHKDDCRILVEVGDCGVARASALPAGGPESLVTAKPVRPATANPRPFPLTDRAAVLRLADEYWTLITTGERDAERSFERELPACRERRELGKDLFVRIARWKSVRKTPNYEANSEDQVRSATRAAFRAESDAGALAALTVLNGVAVRTASALLQWLLPDRYPILDFRIVRALGEAKPSNWDDPRLYERIAAVVRGHAKRLEVDLRTLDRALWAWDKQGRD